jgi:hypothetical protein
MVRGGPGEQCVLEALKVEHVWDSDEERGAFAVTSQVVLSPLTPLSSSVIFHPCPSSCHTHLLQS